MHSPNAPAALLDDIQCTLDSVAASDRTGLNVGKNSQEVIRLAASGDERTQKLIMLSMLDCIHLQVGALVTFVGLQARPELNGRHGVIIGDRAGARYPVHVCGMTAIHSQRGSLFTVTDGPGSGMPERLSVKPCSLRHWMPDEADRPQAAALDLCRFAMDQDSVSLLETVLGAMRYHGPDAEEVLNIPVNKEHNRLLCNTSRRAAKPTSQPRCSRAAQTRRSKTPTGRPRWASRATSGTTASCGSSWSTTAASTPFTLPTTTARTR